MLVLIDESGDPGFRLEEGSTHHFVVAMVIFEDNESAERCSAAIKELRQKLRISGEFKFSKSSRTVRDRFFDMAAGHNFRIRALVVDKKKIYSPNLRSNDDRFYNYFVRSLLKHHDGWLKEASVKIDGSGDREFKRALELYIRREVPRTAVKKVKFADSARDDLIQLADMVVGAIARSYREDEDRTTRNRWRSMLRTKISDVWEFE